MELEQSHIDTLKRLILEAVDCTARVPSDFYRIAAWVETRTSEIIGLSTLKRFYQYGGASTQPRLSTLDLLSKALGFRNYANFVAWHGCDAPASDPLPIGGLRAENMEVGDRIEVRWNPGREMVATHLGNATFRVVHSVATHLQPSDTFVCHQFVLGYPAMLSNVIYADGTFPLYEIGKQGGLTMVKHLKKEES